MQEAIRKKWGTPSPNTYIDGTVPIDAIFCTTSLDITSAGYTSIFYGLQTDHRMIWVDISVASAFGKDTELFHRAPARRLQLDYPNIVDQYLGQRLYLMAKNQLLERVRALYEKVLSGSRGLIVISELEKLDRLRTSDMLTAENRCRKIKAGQVAWSPTLQNSIDILRYLRLVISKHRIGNQINCRTIRKAFLHSKLNNEVFTLESALALLTAEKKSYKDIKVNAESKRKSFLEALAEEKADHMDTDASTMLKQLQLRENQRALSRQLHRIKDKPKQGLQSLEVLRDDHWITITNKSEIEKECMIEGKKRFEQANNTACLTLDQIALLGWTANTEHSQAVLDGIIPTNLHADIKHIASYLAMPTSVKTRTPINAVMDRDQYVSGWAKAKEKTSSGISGLHFGHFKANSMMNQTLEIDLKLLQMTIILGYSLLRWRSAVDVMIPKKSDSKRADQLRVICLMEPDYNFMNKWLGKITMSNAEASSSIAPEQFGSRKHKSAIQHAFNKALCFDTLRIMKDDCSLTVLDAKSCYDRIPPPLACICLRRQGLPQNIIDASFNSIKDMTHHIRTAYGVSTVSYERDDDSYLHGILQGNGAGPCIWVMLSSPILDMLAETGNGAILQLPDGKTIKVVAFAFVDDIDLIQKLPRINPLPALQHDFDIWENGLRTISGALVWKKCDVYILQNIWDDRLHNWSLATQQQLPGSILVEEEGHLIAINRKEPNLASLSLGVMFAPGGSMADQVTHLRNKSEAWADLLRTKRISPEAAWYSLQSSIMKSIEYPLLATTISQKQFSFIMAPILLSALPRAKICRYLSRDVLYSLPMHHGMGLQNPFYTQGIRKLMEVLHEDCSLNPSQKFIKAADMAMEMYTGLGPNYMQFDISPLILKTIPNTIMRSLWEFLFFYNITLTKIHNDQWQYHSDNYIMRILFKSKLKPKEVATFNFCRLYLQVSKLSDFITLDGKSIRKHIWQGSLLSHQNHDSVWPHQPRPSSSAWLLFRKTLQLVFSTNASGVLNKPISIDGWNRRNWKWLLCQSTSRLYEANSHKNYFVHSIANTSSRRTRRQGNLFWHKISAQEPLPVTAIPVTVFINHGYINVEQIIPLKQHIHHHIHLHWSDFLRVQRNVDTTSLDNSFFNGHLVLVSDGSYKDSEGSAAWILSCTKTYETFATGQCPTSGPTQAQDSHRSELFGILSGLLFLNRYLKKFNLDNHPSSITIGLDNTSAMNYVFDKHRYPVVKSYYPDFDVIMSARSLLHPLITYTTVHIAGHQDDNFIGPLAFLPTLNVQMDIACKAFRGIITKDLSNAILPNQKLYAKFQQQILCKQIETTIREGISADTMKKYWARHDSINDQRYHEVEWRAIGHAMTKEPIIKRHWIVKHSTGICGVNSKLLQWKEKDTDKCARCGLIETAEHVWICQHISSQIVWDRALQDLHLWLVQNSASPAIIESLLNGLRQWYEGSPTSTNCILADAQRSIGWQHIITGKFHVMWMDIQQHHFTTIGRGKKSSRRWLANLISRIWKIAWELWEVRNEHEHEADIATTNLRFTIRIEEELAIGFHNVHETCRYLFSDREITHLRTTANLEYKRHWIDLVAAARHIMLLPTSQIPLPISFLPV